MPPILLIDGNNLGHALGYIDKTAARYDSAALLACLDGVACYLATQGQQTEILLFLDDVYAAERLGGWHVRVAPVPGGDADAAIRAYAQAHADHTQILVSGDQALCEDVTMWGVVCLSPQAFISRYLVPAQRAGLMDESASQRFSESAAGEWLAAGPHQPLSVNDPSLDFQGGVERRRQDEALARAGATLRGEPPPAPGVYRLDLGLWADEAGLALYLAEHHLCSAHADLTDPGEMVTAIRAHCCHQPRYFSAGPVIERVFRLFLCRPEHTLSLDDLARLGRTRRRKVKAALEKYGGRLGIKPVW